MRTKLKEVNGIDWFDGAVMNCRWRGPRLRDVLLKSGVKIPRDKWSSAHVAFACFQTPCQDDEWYGASIELGRAMREDADVILALEVSFYIFLILVCIFSTIQVLFTFHRSSQATSSVELFLFLYRSRV
jgi:Oxidoreductase molybdopterin binding domain